MKIFDIPPAGKIASITDDFHLAAILDADGKIITIKTFDTFDDAEAALDMIAQLTSNNFDSPNQTIEEYVAEQFQNALAALNLTLSDIAPIKKPLANIFMPSN